MWWWIIFGLLILFYIWIVPSWHGDLGSLENSKSTELVYKKDFWKQHHTVHLPFGKCHYFLVGPEDGTPIVFVHGISGPSICFPTVIESLSKKGYRVLVPDLYGRGYSSSPSLPNNQDLFASQISHLLHHLHWNRVHLIGMSLGGAIVVRFASLFPKSVKTITLVAPTGVMDDIPPLGKLLQVPFIGELFFYSLGPKLLVKLSESNHAHKTMDVEHFMKVNRSHLANNPGFWRSYLSTIRHFNFTGMALDYQSMETNKIPVQFIWGDLDRVVPFDLVPKVKKLVPSAKFVIAQGFSHSVLAENPSFCVDAIASFNK